MLAVRLDTLLERLLLRSGRKAVSAPRLASRIQRAAFLLAVLMAGSLVATSLLLQTRNLLDSIHVAHETTLQVLANELRSQLDATAHEAHFLSQSSLVWTALTDSAGRDSYLSPYLRSQQEKNALHSFTLLDYRNRYIAGSRRLLDAPPHGAGGARPEIAALLAQARDQGRPAARVLAQDRRLLMAFPVLYPVTRDVIGILVAELDLARLIQSRASTLGDRLGLALALDGHELQVYPAVPMHRHLSLSTRIAAREIRDLYRFDLELFARRSPWVAPILILVGTYLAVSVLLIWATWRLSGRVARGLTRRLDRLAEAVAQGHLPQVLPGEPEQDEIGILTRVLRDSLRANRNLTEHLEEQVAQRTQELAASVAQYRFLAENIKDVVWVLDVDTLRFTYVSPSVERLRGYTPEEILAQPVDAALTPEAGAALKAVMRERAAACLGGSLAPDQFFIDQLEQPCKDGSSVWTEVVTCYRLDESNGHVRVLGVTRDISERLHAEELERYSAFQAGVAEMGVSVLHNVGNAVTALLNDATALGGMAADVARVGQLLASGAEQGDQAGAGPAELARRIGIEREAAAVLRRLAEENLAPRSQRIVASVQHIAEIIRIQQHAALPEAQFSSFDLDQALRDALAMREDVLTRHRIWTVIDLDPALGRVTLPRNRFLQALINVIRNAEEAIQVRRVRADDARLAGRIRIRTEALAGDRFRISVSDNGIGVAAEDRGRLFRFGYSTKDRGSGFGLHATALFVQEMGGRIALGSDGPDQGARLTLELPRVPAGLTAPGQEAA